jgi:TetR/AcrR family transcriptional regulator, tetracycline repressor protein
MAANIARRLPPGPKPGLTRDAIVDAALQILDGGDPSALTMRRLSAHLEVGPMTLYRYFSSRADLEEAIAARVMPDAATELDSAVPWHESLRRLMVAMHDALYAHPGAAALIAERSTSAPGMDRMRERTLAILISSGMDHDDAVRAGGAIGRYVIGCALASGSRRRSATGNEADRLRRLPVDEYPVLTEFADIYSEHTSSDTMRFGLDLLIRGLRDLLVERGEPSTGSALFGSE